MPIYIETMVHQLMSIKKQVFHGLLSLSLLLPQIGFTGSPVRPNTFKIGNVNVQITQEKPTASKHFVSANFVYGNLKHIKVDKNQDGFAEEMIIETEKFQIEAFNPRGLNYVNLRVQVREPKGYRTLHLILNPSRTSYQLLDQSFEKYKVSADGIFSESFSKIAKPVEDQSPEGHSCGESQNSASNQLSVLQRTLGSAERSVAGLNESGLISDNCDSGYYKKDLKKGVALVTNEEASGDRYLSCLRENRMTALANLLDAKFKKYMKIKKPPDPPWVSCQPRYIEKPGFPLVINDSIESEDEEHHEHAHNHNNDGQVLGTFNHASMDITFYENPGLKNYSSKKRERYYSDLFFHESLHSAGFLKEEDVRGIEMCCGSDDTYSEQLSYFYGPNFVGPPEPRCGRVKRYAEEKYKTDILLSNLSLTIPGFNEFLIREAVYHLGITKVREIFANFRNDFVDDRDGKVKLCVENLTDCKSTISNLFNSAFDKRCQHKAPGLCGALQSSMSKLVGDYFNNPYCALDAVKNEHSFKNLFGWILPKALADNKCVDPSKIAEQITASSDYDPQDYEDYQYDIEEGEENTGQSAINNNGEPQKDFQNEDKKNSNETQIITIASESDSSYSPTIGSDQNPVRSKSFDVNNISEAKQYVRNELRHSRALIDKVTQVADYVRRNALPQAQASTSSPKPRFDVSVPVRGKGKGSFRVDREPASLDTSNIGANKNKYQRDQVLVKENGVNPVRHTSQNTRDLSSSKVLRASSGPKRISSGSLLSVNDASSGSGGVTGPRNPANTQNERLQIQSRLDLQKYLKNTSYKEVEKDMKAGVHTNALRTIYTQVELKDGSVFGADSKSALFRYRFDKNRDKFVRVRKWDKDE